MNARLREDHDLAHLRVPPQSIEAEQAVLGGLMLAPDALPNVADLLTDSDFYRRDHQLIWTAIVELEEKKRPYDAVTLGEWFESHGQLELVAGGAYLIELASTTPSAANIRAYAEIVRDKALLRAGIEAGTAFVGACYQPGGRETSEILAEGAARVARLTVQGAGDGGLRMVRAGVAEAYEEVAARYNGTIDVGLTPPWSNVRQKLPGLEDTDFCVVAGRPGMGKTIVGLEWAYHAAMQGRNVAFFSLEMSRKQLIVRMMSRHGRVDSQKMRMKGALSDEEWTRLSAASRDIKALPLAIGA
jgi:replicative DNA helicase